MTDMGAHARFIWPAYGAFLVIFAALCLWVRITGLRARAELERRERARDARRKPQ
ncbi:heme exporter protein CcmD [Pikeienuella sp. HZG-20]|uniref:heme exporter protein CcmD n=1 Tax=Paludibacillus litoralis TaxID=3133267 RepID=UPI0030ECBDD2